MKQDNQPLSTLQPLCQSVSHCCKKVPEAENILKFVLFYGGGSALNGNGPALIGSGTIGRCVLVGEGVAFSLEEVCH